MSGELMNPATGGYNMSQSGYSEMSDGDVDFDSLGENPTENFQDDLLQFIEQATWVTVNDYEWQLMHERTGLSPEQVSEKVEALIITKGGEGSSIYSKDGEVNIPVAKAVKIADPTGCGDAYRAGLLYGLHHKFDWEVTGRIASLMGSIKIATPGTQNHRFSLDSFKTKYEQEFGSSF